MNLTELVYSVVKRALKMSGSSRRTALSLGVSLSLLAICPLLFADEGNRVMRVEEDWEVVLNQPNLNMNAPQFHTACSPFGSVSALYLQICWNYREQAEFAPGGLQLVAWVGDWVPVREPTAGTSSVRSPKRSPGPRRSIRTAPPLLSRS